MSDAVPQPLAVRRLGDGPRDVLALHCTMAHSGAWRGIAEALQGTARLTALDMLNHGDSPDWDGQGEFQLRMAEAAIAHIEAPMDLLGHSFGATVALRIAILRPDLVLSLTMIEPVLLSVVAADAPEMLAEERAHSAPFRAAIEAGDFLTAARLFNRGWGAGGDGPRWDDLPGKVQAAMARGVQIVPACGPSITEDLPGFMAPGGLDAVTMPVLLMHGADTAPIIRKVNVGLARRLPNARIFPVAGAGHMAPITHPAATAEAIRVFLEAVPG